MCESVIRYITNWSCDYAWSVTLQTGVTKHDPLTDMREHDLLIYSPVCQSVIVTLHTSVSKFDPLHYKLVCQSMIRYITNWCERAWFINLQLYLSKCNLLHYKLICQTMIRYITNGCNKVWSVPLQTGVTKYHPFHYKHNFGLNGIRSCDQPDLNLHRHPKTASYLLNKAFKAYCSEITNTF